MPGKKKKKGGKKKKPTSASSSEKLGQGQTLDHQDESFMEGTSGAASKTKKKGKKKKKATKLTLDEKRLLKLEKGCDYLKENRYDYEHFVECMDDWLIKRGNRLVRFLKTYDATEDGVVSYEELKSTLFDMNCPANQVELHQLCKLLDPENSGDIEYLELNKGLRWFIKITLEAKEELEDVEVYDESSENALEDFKLIRGENAKQIKKCRFCMIGLWKPGMPDIEYIELTVMLITFADTMKNHPCHFTKVVHNHITVYGLIQLITHEVGIQSTTITIFRDKSRAEEARLEETMTLAEYGLDGRDWYNPIEHVLFYDYTSEFNECPILMCDHYFT